MKKVFLIGFFTFIFSFNSALAKPAYPIILVHGINSSDQMWEDCGLTQHFESLAWSYNEIGSKLHVHLNMSDSTNLVGPNDVQTFFPNPVSNSDFYLVNFQVRRDGTLYEEDNEPNQSNSNESAIYKQGYAI